MKVGAMLTELKYILSIQSIRSAEFLLATIKLMLGIQIILSALGPHPRTILGPTVAFVIGVTFLLIAVIQALGVLNNWLRFRQVAALLACFMWLFFVGSVWQVSGSPQNVLVYVPLLLFNIMLFFRVARLPSGRKRGGNE